VRSGYTIPDRALGHNRLQCLLGHLLAATATHVLSEEASMSLAARIPWIGQSLIILTTR